MKRAYKKNLFILLIIFWHCLAVYTDDTVDAAETSSEDIEEIQPWEGNSWDWEVAFCYPEDFEPEEENFYILDGEYISQPTYTTNGMRTITGWYAAGEETPFDFNTPITDDLELYPILDKYMVQFYPDRIDINEKKTIYVAINGTVIAPEFEPPGEKYVLVGWQNFKGEMMDFSKPILGDIKLFAKWKKIQLDTEVLQNPIVKPDTIALSEYKLILPKGETHTIKAQILPLVLKDSPLVWESSDCEVADVEDGRLTAISAGTARVTAKTGNGLIAACKVIVADVKLNAVSTVLQIKTSSDAVKIEAKYPFSDKVESYRSSNSQIVKVDAYGNITAGKKTGKARITVQMRSGANASYKVTVQKQKVVTRKLQLSDKKVVLRKGKNFLLIAEKVPISAKEKIAWSTSNKKTVTVSKNGKVTAKKKGSAKITAKTSNGKKATCRIIVK